MKVRIDIAAAAIIITLQVCSTYGQGSLTPPTGTPAPTMKTLDQVEPRIPITSIPYHINSPGSYYLTGNFSSAGNGITIKTNDVTLDLMGHTLSGQGGSSRGIYILGSVGSPLERIRISNGNILNFFFGIKVEYGNRSHFKGLTLNNNEYGIYMDGQGFGGSSDGHSIESCTLSRNLSNGIFMIGTSSGQCNGNRIANCLIEGNGTYGIIFNGSIGECNGNSISDCTVIDSGYSGIHIYKTVGSCIGNSISGCTVSGNGKSGIDASGGEGTSIVRCNASNNSEQGIMSGSQASVMDCVANFNTGDGISSTQESSIERCHARYNNGDGIRVTIACNVKDNVCDKNGNGASDGAGIHVVNYDNVIDGNRVYGCDRGIDVDSYYNLIIRNRARSNTINYDIANLNRVGPIVSAPSSSPISGSTGGAGLGTTDPWANFSY